MRGIFPSQEEKLSQMAGSGITFLFTDIEGSTKLWEDHPGVMEIALARHDDLLRRCIEKQKGCVFKTVGDGFCAAFSSPLDAVLAAMEAQHLLSNEQWETPKPLRVRMGIHAGKAVVERDGDYFGPTLNRVARLMASAHGGQIVISSQTQESLGGVLPDGISLRDIGTHRFKDLAEPDRIFQVVAKGLTSDFPPLKTLDFLPTNLPRQFTPFLGREGELNEVKKLLRSNPLLTLTGSGGCGKTRLALQAGADLLEEYADGVWLVELANLADPALLERTAALALGLRGESQHSLEETLQDKNLLVILDNCEHIIQAAADFASKLLKNCAKVKILATSREPLSIRGELAWRVPSLSWPDPATKLSPDALTQFGAVQLFVQAAQTSDPRFALTEKNAGAVAEICRRLDGIPLAIELAAARAKVLSVEQIAKRLMDRFQLLASGERSIPLRQQTLRATLDWSYELLAEQEKRLLQRIAVFRGGFTLEAAEQVGLGEPIFEGELLDLLFHLVDKSLVLPEVEDAGEKRYHLLESVREYSLEKLAESGEAQKNGGRHLDFFLELAEAAGPKLSGPEQMEWLSKLEPEHDNFREALTFCLKEPEEIEKGLRLAVALHRFWLVRGHMSEGRSWAERLLDAGVGSLSPRLHAGALLLASHFACEQFDLDASYAYQEKALPLFREAADELGIARVLKERAAVLSYKRDFAGSRKAGHEALAIFERLSDRLDARVVMSILGNVAFEEGNLSEASAFWEEGLTIAREIGDLRSIANMLHNLGAAACAQKDYKAGRAFTEESLTYHRQIGDQFNVAYSLHNLAYIAIEEKDYASALAFLQECLKTQKEIGSRFDLAYVLIAFALLFCVQGDFERTTHLLGASEKLRRSVGAPFPADAETDKELCMAGAKEALPPERFDVLWREGEQMSVEQIMIYCLG